MTTPSLTRSQIKKLKSLTPEWREEPYEWKSGIVFYRLELRGLCEMKSMRVSGGDVLTGPGNTSVYRWFTRITPAGLAALPGNAEQPQKES